MPKIGSTKGSFNSLRKELQADVNRFKNDLRDSIESEVEKQLQDNINISIDNDNVNVSVNINQGSIDSKIQESVSKQIPKTTQVKTEVEVVPEIKVASVGKIKGINFDEFIQLDEKALSKKLGELYKKAEDGSIEAEKKFFSAYTTAKARGFKIDNEDYKEFADYIQSTVELTEQEINKINNTIAQIDLSPMTTGVKKDVADVSSEIKELKNNVKEYNEAISKMKKPAFHIGNIEENQGTHIADHLWDKKSLDRLGSGLFVEFDPIKALQDYIDQKEVDSNTKLYITDLDKILPDMANLPSEKTYEEYVKFLGIINNYIMNVAKVSDTTDNQTVLNNNGIKNLDDLYKYGKEYFDHYEVTKQKLSSIIEEAVQYVKTSPKDVQNLDDLSSFIQQKAFGLKGVSTKNSTVLDNYSAGSVVFHREDLEDIYSVADQDDLIKETIKTFVAQAIKEKAANKGNSKSDIEDIVDEYKESYPIINELFSQQELNNLLSEVGVIKGFRDIITASEEAGRSISDFMKSIQDGSLDASDDLKDVVKELGIVSDVSTLDNGTRHSDGFISDEYTVIGRELEYLEKTQKLMPLLDEAEKRGVNVGRIIGTIAEEEEGLFYEIQKTQQGTIIDQDNLSFLEATDEELAKLKQDLSVLQELGLFVDTGGQNLLYQKGKGFSFIDLAIPKDLENVPDFLTNTKEGILESFEEFLPLDRSTFNILDEYAEKFEAFGKRLDGALEQPAKNASAALDSIFQQKKEIDDWFDSNIKGVGDGQNIKTFGKEDVDTKIQQLNEYLNKSRELKASISEDMFADEDGLIDTAKYERNIDEFNRLEAAIENTLDTLKKYQEASSDLDSPSEHEDSIVADQPRYTEEDMERERSAHSEVVRGLEHTIDGLREDNNWYQEEARMAANQQYEAEERTRVLREQLSKLNTKQTSFYEKYGTPSQALDAGYFSNVREVLDELGDEFKQMDENAEDFSEQKLNLEFFKSLASQLDLSEDSLTVIKASIKDIEGILPGGEFAHLTDPIHNATAIDNQLKNIKEIIDGTRQVTEEEVSNAKQMLDAAKEYADAKQGNIEIQEEEARVIDRQNQSLEEKLEYLKKIRAESHFMETAQERLSDMEDKAWDVGGNNPKSEADSQKKIKAYEDLETHIEEAEKVLDEFEDTYEQVIVTMKNGEKVTIYDFLDLDDLSLAKNKIKDIEFVLKELELTGNEKKELSVSSPSQQFDTEIQQNLVMLKNYENTIKEIDKLKLDPETEETKAKLEELNKLADYFAAQITVIRSESGHEVNSSMMYFNGVPNPHLMSNYTSEDIKHFTRVAHERAGLNRDNVSSEFQGIEQEIKDIESKSNGLLEALKKGGLEESEEYISKIRAALINLIDAKEELATAKPGSRDALAYQKDIDYFSQKFPEILQFYDKLSTYDEAEEFVKTDEWMDFLATLPQAHVALEALGYDFERLSQSNENSILSGSEGQAEQADQYKKISEDTVSILGNIGKSEDEIVSSIREEIKAAKELNEENREHLVLLDKQGKVIADHLGSTSNVSGAFTEEQLAQAKGGKLLHVHPGNSSFFGGKDLTHMLQDAQFSQIKQIELLWGDSTLSIDKSTLTKETQSALLNIMRNVRNTLTEMYGDNPNGMPSKEARDHINAIEKEIFKIVSRKLDISVAENGQQAQDVTNALKDVDKAIIERFRNIEEKAIKDVNVSDIIANKNNLSSGGTTPSAVNEITQAEDRMGNEAQEATDQAKQGLAEMREEAEKTTKSIANVLTAWNGVDTSSNERFMLANSQTGYYTDPTAQGDYEFISQELVNSAIKNAEETVDTMIHTHPDKLAAFTHDDIFAAVEEMQQGIVHQYVKADSEVSYIDFSKLGSKTWTLIAKDFERRYNQLLETDGWYEGDNVTQEMRDDFQSKMKQALKDSIAFISGKGIDFSSSIYKTFSMDDIRAMQPMSQSPNKTPALFEESSGQLSFIENLISAEEKLGDTAQETAQDIRSANEQIDGQMSFDDYLKGKEAVDKFTESIKENKSAKQKSAKTDIKADETAQEAGKEADKIDEVGKAAKGAGKEKEKFAEANGVVLKSIVTSLKGLEQEGNAFDSLNKLIKTLSKDNNMDKTVEGLKKIRDTLSSPISDNSLINALKELASQGENLKNLATVLSKSSKQIGAAQSAVSPSKSKPTNPADSLYDKWVQDLKEIQKLQKSLQKNGITTAEQNDIASKIKNNFRDIIQIKKDIAKTNSVDAVKEAEILRLSKEIHNENKLTLDIEKEKVGKNADTLIDQLNALRTGRTKEYSDMIDNTIVEINRLKSEMSSATDLNVVKEKAKEIQAQFDSIDGTKTFKQYKQAAEASLSKVRLKIEEIIAKNSAMGNKFKEQFENLKLRLDTAESTEEVQKITAEINNLKAEITAAGKAGSSFFNTLAKRIKQMTTNWLAMYFSMYDIIRYIRTLTTNITEIDSALTELRKVSDASTKRLAQNFETSAKTAQQLGSTIKDVINVTSDWARLNNIGLLYSNV